MLKHDYDELKNSLKVLLNQTTSNVNGTVFFKVSYKFEAAPEKLLAEILASRLPNLTMARKAQKAFLQKSINALSSFESVIKFVFDLISIMQHIDPKSRLNQTLVQMCERVINFKGFDGLKQLFAAEEIIRLHTLQEVAELFGICEFKKFDDSTLKQSQANLLSQLSVLSTSILLSHPSFRTYYCNCLKLCKAEWDDETKLFTLKEKMQHQRDKDTQSGFEMAVLK